ncbi:MAG: hemerythrin family protein [Myxococcales bacterium]|nr:hemerythrin family protein [Myxococcales bacterium]MCB9583534.1 hemerythrin family protein [Polyangiaceae bacterium]
MALFAWKDEYSVKVPSIDVQHKKLVELLNELHEAMTQGKSTEHLGHVLGGLIKYTAEHFAYEEKLFAQSGYPHAKEHKLEHERLKKQVLDFQKKFTSGEARISIELLRFLKDWTSNHILGSDKRYSAHLVQANVR